MVQKDKVGIAKKKLQKLKQEGKDNLQVKEEQVGYNLSNGDIDKLYAEFKAFCNNLSSQELLDITRSIDRKSIEPKRSYAQAINSYLKNDYGFTFLELVRKMELFFKCDFPHDFALILSSNLIDISIASNYFPEDVTEHAYRECFEKVYKFVLDMQKNKQADNGRDLEK